MTGSGSGSGELFGMLVGGDGFETAGLLVVTELVVIGLVVIELVVTELVVIELYRVELVRVDGVRIEHDEQTLP